MPCLLPTPSPTTFLPTSMVHWPGVFNLAVLLAHPSRQPSHRRLSHRPRLTHPFHPRLSRRQPSHRRLSHRQSTQVTRALARQSSQVAVHLPSRQLPSASSTSTQHLYAVVCSPS